MWYYDPSTHDIVWRATAQNAHLLPDKKTWHLLDHAVITRYATTDWPEIQLNTKDMTIYVQDGTMTSQ